ncbi:MAG: carboxypeptidase [Bdellovibrio sp. CG10_big_fil_rev_8_21_14_0_10_47_8]|nr:MAG: carboxypeptidase [Bdellovibrio sp. CG10_big_fil_rev_8_21_14_0_10_47_8]
MKTSRLALAFVVGLLMIIGNQATTAEHTQYWMKIKAEGKFQRSVVANMGVSIETIKDEYVYAIGNLEEKNQLEKLGWVETSFPLTAAMDFPKEDAPYHNYTELTTALEDLHSTYPELTQIFSIGKTNEGRDILGIRIGQNFDQADQKPGVIYMGGHHAREHLSVEMPLYWATYLLTEYAAGNQRVISLVNSRDIHIIPAVNADGLEYDISTGNYKYWRKNRRQNKDGTYGVDLNRNYGFQWGTGGSSTSTNSDVYMGPTPFSEPETQAVKKYVEDHVNITTLLSFHTFSQLILYPWGHKYASIADQKDMMVHKTMAETMSKWNGYTPEQSSSLYIASGDTTDWSYGEHKIISFTFELDPANSGFGSGGFYPGAKIIQAVVKKNIEPCLYLLEYADNPYRVLPTGKLSSF